MAHNNPERKQGDKVTIAILIGIAIYTVIVSALFPTIFGERMPTALATSLALIDNMTHSPYSTTVDAIAQAAPTFLLVTFYVGIIVTWIEVAKIGNSIAHRLDAS
jgi:hypothetical protein